MVGSARRGPPNGCARRATSLRELPFITSVVGVAQIDALRIRALLSPPLSPQLPTIRAKAFERPTCERDLAPLRKLAGPGTIVRLTSAQTVGAGPFFARPEALIRGSTLMRHDEAYDVAIPAVFLVAIFILAVFVFVLS